MRDLALNDDVTLRRSGVMEFRDARSTLCASLGCAIPCRVVNEILTGSAASLKMTHSHGGRTATPWTLRVALPCPGELRGPFR